MSDNLTNSSYFKNRVRLLMVYDLKKTLNENIISEQTAFTTKLDYLDTVKKQKEFDKGTKEFEDWFSKLDKHNLLTLISIGSFILSGFVSGGVAPLILLGTSLAADLADAYTYYNEGDKYMAGLMFFLSILPGTELGGKLLKGTKLGEFISKYSPEKIMNILKKYKSSTASKEELGILKKFINILEESSTEITELTKKGIYQFIVKELTKKSLKTLLNILINILKILGFTTKQIAKMGIVIGGSLYTYDKLYLYINKDNPENMDIRNNSDIVEMGKVLDGLYNEVKLLIINEIKNKLMNVQENNMNISILNDKVSNYEEDLKIFKENLKKEKTQETLKLITPPTINDVLSRKKDDNNNLVTIHKGQQGDTIKKIQDMLVKSGYEDILTGYLSIPKPIDGYFEKNTEEAVKEFQKDNSLNPDGIVGYETLKKLMKL